MTELRVTVPDDIAERLATEAAERGTSTEDVVAEVLTLHAAPASRATLPPWVGTLHSGQADLAERHEEILKSELGRGA